MNTNRGRESVVEIGESSAQIRPRGSIFSSVAGTTLLPIEYKLVRSVD
ncbi:MAG: hypothetical protein ACXAEU_02670 [Candidatus Hodarchaeales archaeon]